MPESLSERVHDCVLKSLYEQAPETTPPDAVLVPGIVRNFGFDPRRLEAQRETVKGLIGEIVPAPFFKSTGGGWSTLQLCVDRNGNQWGEHRDMEALCVLAIGLGLANWCLPKDMWSAFPGGMPYVQFADLPETETTNA